MKNLASLIILFLTVTKTNASVLTVCNTGGSQYSTLALGLAAASNGDTLMVQGTPYSYGLGQSASFNKRVVVIATGFNSPKELSFPTKFADAGVYNCGNCFTIGELDIRFYGITFLNEVHIGVNSSGLLFDGCIFENQFSTVTNNTSFLFSNSIFKNCIFKSTIDSWGSVSNVVFTHCIFESIINGIGLNNTIEHSVFLRNTGNCFGGAGGLFINNSIFYGNAAITGIGNTAFNNCLALNATADWTINGNTANNCLTSSDPLFVNVPLGSTYNSSLNFHVQSGSPATAGATDGTDIGLYGGVNYFSDSGEPVNFPVVRKVTIQNTSVPQNGNVNVKVRSTKSRTN